MVESRMASRHMERLVKRMQECRVSQPEMAKTHAREYMIRKRTLERLTLHIIRLEGRVKQLETYQDSLQNLGEDEEAKEVMAEYLEQMEETDHFELERLKMECDVQEEMTRSHVDGDDPTPPPLSVEALLEEITGKSLVVPIILPAPPTHALSSPKKDPPL